MAEELLVLVDEQDRETGLKEKQRVHEEGDLHRALSVFIFDSGGRMLLQRRALNKYHSGGLWTNACCSHPRPGEDVREAARRRLREEMGMETELSFAFSFTYKALFDNGLIEHEFDHVFIGSNDEIPVPDPLEVCDYRYLSLTAIEAGLTANPKDYTEWFKLIYKDPRLMIR